MEKSLLLGDNSKVLLIQTAFLGDVILATSVVRSIKAQYPKSTIDVLVKKGNEGLLIDHPDIRLLKVFDKSKKWRECWRIIHENRKESYDIIINLHRFFTSGFITVMSRSSCIGFNKNPLSRFYSMRLPHPIMKGIHETDRNFTLIAALGIKQKAKPLLVPNELARDRVKEFQKEPYVCFAPASVWATKQLPIEKWVELADKINTTIYLLGGPSDKSLCEDILDKAPGKIINLAGQLTLMESIALMKNAQRNYVNDSGPLHFASAVNAPTTAFFCSTVTDFGFGPLADDSEVKEVKELSCRPCGLHGKKECPKGHFRCGKEMVV